MSDRLRKMATQAAEAAVSLTRPSYFDSKDRGELPELRQELLSDTYIIRREAVRKVIAGMTAGDKDDYGELFPEILRCLQSRDVETKRLVYLYLSEYSRDRPDMALLAMNAFVKDSEDKSHIVRSLSLRTMSSLPIPNIADYIDDPLRRAIRDDHFMVRRTAAIAIGKLFTSCRDYFEEMELWSSLQLLMSDSDAFVASNAVAVYLAHCRQLQSRIEVDSHLIARLSLTMEKAGEWGQLNILNLFHHFTAQCSHEQAAVLLKKTSAFLNHSNPAVSVAASRVIMSLITRFSDLLTTEYTRLSTMFSTLLSNCNTPEQRYIIIRMLTGLVSQQPIKLPLSVLSLNPNDPLYVKQAQIDLLVAVVQQDASVLVPILQELCECAKDVDMQVAESAVKSMATMAHRFHSTHPASRQALLQVIIDLSKTGVGHLLKAGLCALRQVWHCTDNPDLIVPVMILFLQQPHFVDSADSRAAVVWLAATLPDQHLQERVLGEFEIASESLPVQLAMLDAAYSLPHHGEWLEWAITSAESALLVHRALLYKTLLSNSVQVQVTDSITGDSREADLEWMVSQLGMLSTVYHYQIVDEEPGVGTDSDSTSIADYMTDFTI